MQAKMLEGKVAIVSGASYGMGFSMAELFAEEGARVVMTARGQEKLDAAVKQIRDQGLEVTGVVADNKNLDVTEKYSAITIIRSIEAARSPFSIRQRCGTEIFSSSARISSVIFLPFLIRLSRSSLILLPQAVISNIILSSEF